MRRWSRERVSARLVTGGLAVLLAGAALAAPAGAALVTGTGWKIQNSPNVTAPDGQLESVSCSAASACTAVGAADNAKSQNVTLAERWNGTSWQQESTPQPGRTIPDSSPALTGVSCPTSTFCEAVGVNSVVFTQAALADEWNGHVWKQQPFAGPAGSTSSSPSEVSCTSASFCEAVGSSEDASDNTVPLAAQWNGSSWRVQRLSGIPSSLFGNRLTGVSCVSTTFCMALGGSFAERWNGTAWHTENLPDSVGVGSVSCASAAFCEVVGEIQGNADVWNGSSWSAQTTPVPAGAASSRLAGVSCATAAFCEAVGQYTDSSGDTLSLGVAWNGTSWALQTTPNPVGVSVTSLSQVSCVSATACETSGSSQVTSSSAQAVLAGSWNGSSWTIQHAASPQGAVTNNLSAVSCTSTAFCEAVGSRFAASSATTVALAQTWNGTTWKIQKTPGPSGGMTLTGVSCVSTAFCEAVGSIPGTGGGAEIWNGTAWALQTVPGGNLTAVSCTSASFCMAAGSDGHVDIWNGTSWSSQMTSASLMSLSGVSCTSATSCEAVGDDTDFNAAAEGWNGTSWTAQTVPVPSNGSSPTLSAVSCTGAGSCEAVGTYTSGTTSDEVPLAEVWNGTAWTAQSAPVPASAFISLLAGVWCTSAKFCTAAGQYTPGTGPSGTVAEVWNGTAWKLANTPNRLYAGQNSLASVSCGASTACTAVGSTTNPGQTPATLVETGD
jgi:hypothetical protein